MSIFSYHIVSTSYFTAIRALLSAPKAYNTPGLLHAECMTAMTLGSNIFSPSRMQLSKLILFAQWETEEAIDTFLTKKKLGKDLAKGWHIRLQFLRHWGSINEFKIPKETNEIEDYNSPVVAVTLARMRLMEVPRFIRWGKPVETLVRDHPGTTLSMASIRLPRTVSTFSIWKSLKEMTEMVQGHSKVPQPKRHFNAMKERDRKDFHLEFTTLRFKPISEFGEWNGVSDYIPKTDFQKN